ncbi:MAG TPA: arsenic resistance N-acetyltransferase ArsN2 [Candidatus Krumholzibacteria bacterium]|nr:arsenic resistance N-acetyltransferase ArsN2 [Candidatus Krumholzibacteria bacterium]
MRWVLRNAQGRDEATVRTLLHACDLSSLGLEAQLDRGYVVAHHENEIVGVAGIEVHGSHGLLRSLAVAPSRRDAGLGAELVRNRIHWARQQGIESIYLLTTTAAEFFARHGFAVASRDEAPDEIRASREFSEMCPSTAVFMKLARGGA